MKKLILSAAFLIALNHFAAAQTTSVVTTAQETTEKATTEKKEKVKKISKKDQKAAAAIEANKSVKISIPVPDISKDTFPRKEEE